MTQWDIMRVLQVNKFLYRRAGAEAYMLDLAELLAEHGHEVMLWGMRPPHPNPLLVEERIQVRGELLLEPLDYDKREGFGRDLNKLGHMVWSLEAARKFEQVLKQFKPDIIHLHNIYHHISPSILAVARQYKISVVQTLHDFKFICPNYRLFTQSAVCQRCKRYKYWNAVRYRCLQGSCAASTAAALEMWTHRALQIYEKDVAKFITPSKFLRELLIEWGKDGNKIVHVPNFVSDSHSEERSDEESHTNVSMHTREIPRFARNDEMCDYILFAGRLAEEKGLWSLLEIAKALPEIKFKIAGTGPEFEKSVVSSQKLGLKNVELLGFKSKDKLQELIAGARMVIVPSLWYENYPMSVLEAQSMGKAVIASAIGGILEMIEDGKTGFLIEESVVSSQKSGVELWVDRIKKIYYDDALLQKVGEEGRERVMRENGAEEHYDKILEIYRNAGNQISN